MWWTPLRSSIRRGAASWRLEVSLSSISTLTANGSGTVQFGCGISHRELARLPARVRALAMLGLDEAATPEQIRTAFRRMSQIHHPDRFAALGNQAVHAATESFRRIREAYEYLTSDA